MAPCSHHITTRNLHFSISPNLHTLGHAPFTERIQYNWTSDDASEATFQPIVLKQPLLLFFYDFFIFIFPYSFPSRSYHSLSELGEYTVLQLERAQVVQETGGESVGKEHSGVVDQDTQLFRGLLHRAVRAACKFLSLHVFLDFDFRHVCRIDLIWACSLVDAFMAWG